MRKGITDVVLNAIITMVLVIVVLSVGFSVYSIFIANTNTQAVFKSFDEFIEPIKDVCQGEGYSEAVSLSMPLNPEWSYGIIQTRIDAFGPGYPIAMKKCEDSYCLCLFRVRVQDWDVWKSQGSPLWIWNPPGPDLFAEFVVKIVIEFIITSIISILMEKVASVLAGHVSCDKACETNPYVLLCKLACTTAVYAIAYAISYAVRDAINTLIKELWESLAFFNYPSHLMGADDVDNLLFKDADGNFSCTLNAKLDAWEELQSDALDALEAGAMGFLQGLISGAITGFFKGLGDIAKDVTAGAKLLDESQWGKLENLATFLGKHAGARFTAKLGKALAKVFLDLLGEALVFKLKQLSAMLRLDVSDPLDLKPECNVGELLAGRQYVNGFDFVYGGKYFGGPKTTYDENAFNLNPGSLDVFECVRIDELGPKCDGNTKILLDSDHDAYLVYRLTDPLADTFKALFCVYAEQAADVNKDYLEDFFRSLEGVPVIGPVLNWGPMKTFLKFLVGDVILAGQYAIQGMMMECVIPQFTFIQKSYYFQYWAPYPDLHGITGIDGDITIMETYLVDYNETYTVSDCRNEVVAEWQDCLCDHWVADFGGGCPSDIYSADYNKLKGCIDVAAEYEENDDVENCIEALYSSGDSDIAAVSECDDVADEAANCFWAVTDTFHRTEDGYPTCSEIWNMEYEKCKPGVHINPLGVVR